MTKTVSILTILVLFTSFVTENKPTDLKEYGFKGKVKSVTTVNYSNLEQKKGPWLIADCIMSSKSIITFNEEGNITEAKEYYPLIDTLWNEVTLHMDYLNGRKSKFTKTDLFDLYSEIGFYTWIDDFNYELISTRDDGLIIKSLSTLNKNFRDISGEYSYIMDDTTILSASYINKLKPNGEIKSSIYTDKKTGEKSVVCYTDKERDEKGNLINVAVVYKESKTLKQLTVRTFEYYD